MCGDKKKGIPQKLRTLRAPKHKSTDDGKGQHYQIEAGGELLAVNVDTARKTEARQSVLPRGGDPDPPPHNNSATLAENVLMEWGHGEFSLMKSVFVHGFVKDRTGSLQLDKKITPTNL